MNIQEKNRYLSKAKKLLDYYEPLYLDDRQYWGYAYDIVVDWIAMMDRDDVNLEEKDILVFRVLNPPELQGSLFIELESYIKKWYSS